MGLFNKNSNMGFVRQPQYDDDFIPVSCPKCGRKSFYRKKGTCDSCGYKRDKGEIEKILDIIERSKQY